MSQSLIRRIFVLLLAVFVTAGMGLSAVQASTMSIKMMDLAPGMGASGSGRCDDCGGSGDSKGMGACVTSGCIAPLVSHVPSVEIVDLAFVAVRHMHLDIALLGRDSGPDPYPPRISDIG